MERLPHRARPRGIVSSRASGARVEAESFAPPDDLADVIERFWIARWDLSPDAPHVTELLGDPSVHIVAERGSGRVVGVWTRRWERRLEGRGEVRAAKLRPGAVRAFFTVPAHQLTDRITPPEAVSELTRISLESVLEPLDDREGLTLLADRLRRLRRADLATEVERAVSIAALLGDETILTVDALARRAAVSKRNLQRIFREHVGAPAKLLLRRARLQQAAARIDEGNAPNLARLAADLGYHDQAHLTRDLRAMLGKTPRALEEALR
ncbi:MAG: helix-turn-helix transcriptional regulator [Myxococcales bacterium]|nr:helix-turn-helix transcriptional regulator [Myxococcales bacterium]